MRIILSTAGWTLITTSRESIFASSVADASVEVASEDTSLANSLSGAEVVLDSAGVEAILMGLFALR